MKRREFLKHLSAAGAAFALLPYGPKAIADEYKAALQTHDDAVDAFNYVNIPQIWSRELLREATRQNRFHMAVRKGYLGRTDGVTIKINMPK